MREPFKKSWVRDTFESLVVTVILALFGISFVVQAFQIPTGSMENTLLIGDHLLVNKFAFGSRRGWTVPGLAYRDVARGDIVVFRYPHDPREHYVKRVVGLPGDRVRIRSRVVYVNSKELEETSYVRHSYPPQVLRAGDDFPPKFPGMKLEWSEELPKNVKGGELVVPPGNYFVMGDNREESQDSRFWGFVPQELVSGRPLIIYASFEKSREDYRDRDPSVGGRRQRLWGWIKDLARKLRDLPGRIRGRRTLRIVR